MKNCSDCAHMRMRIPVISGERIKQKLDYKNAVSRCTMGHLLDKDGNLRSFRLYSWCENPKVWVEAIFCEDYIEANVAQELANLIIRANEMLGKS